MQPLARMFWGCCPARYGGNGGETISCHVWLDCRVLSVATRVDILVWFNANHRIMSVSRTDSICYCNRPWLYCLWASNRVKLNVTVIRHNSLTTHTRTRPRMYLRNLNLIFVKFDRPLALIVPLIYEQTIGLIVAKPTCQLFWDPYSTSSCVCNIRGLVIPGLICTYILEFFFLFLVVRCAP